MKATNIIIHVLLLVLQRSCVSLRLANNAAVLPFPGKGVSLYNDTSSLPFPPWKYCPTMGCESPIEADWYKKPTDFTTESSATPWGSSDHCRLRNALDKRGTGDVIFTVSGGSATAGAGLEKEEKIWFKSLEENMGQGATFNNAAQGGTESFWGASMMDSIVGDADVLFWEYAINDIKGASTGTDREKPESMRQGVEFFIRKALGLPRKPALVFVYLWDPVLGSYKDNFHSTAYDEQKAVLQEFANAGLDITVIPVERTMRDMRADTDMRSHHPGGGAHNAIAKFVQNQLMQAASTASSGCSDAQHRAIGDHHVAANPDLVKHPVLYPLVQLNSFSGTPIMPNFGQSKIETAYCVQGKCSEVVTSTAGKSEAKRADKKIGYDIPTCASDGTLSLSLDDVKGSKVFVGMHVGGGMYFANTWTHSLKVVANGKPTVIDKLPNSLIGEVGFEHVFNQWMSVDMKGHSNKLSLELCMPDQNVTGNWNSAFCSPFQDGGGRVDFITIFVS